MLKSCPSCSYIGNDGEHVCPFCKADLSVGRPLAVGPTESALAESGHTILRSLGGKRETASRMNVHAMNAQTSLIACYYKREYQDESVALGSQRVMNSHLVDIN